MRRGLLAAAALAGACSGPMALASAAASQPPLTWGDLALMGLGALAGPPFVLGLQVAQRNFRTLRLGWTLGLCGAVYAVTAGLAAARLAARGAGLGGLGPQALTFLVLGAAMMAGLALVRAVFRRHFVPG
ncbi:MAG: hypothetical protein QM788_10425 [Roseateles sp.]|uniref:hypothetical protein n=1 Tax=Roseateles sp. TaxID=1971397 RepID=UPI0039EBDD30